MVKRRQRRGQPAKSREEVEGIGAAIARHDAAARGVNAWFGNAGCVLAEAKAAAAAVKPGARFAGALVPKSMEALRAMSAAARTTYLGPFSSTVTADMANLLWKEVEPFVNGREPDPIDGFDLPSGWSSMRRLLDRILASEPPLNSTASGGWGVQVPLTLICRPDGILYWTVDGKNTPGARREHADGSPDPYTPAEVAHRLVNEAGAAVLMLLWHPRLRARLQRCDVCGRYVLLSQAPKRTPYLCPGECRRTRKRERGDPTNADRQKEHRKRERQRDAEALAEARALLRRRP